MYPKEINRKMEISKIKIKIIIINWENKQWGEINKISAANATRE